MLYVEKSNPDFDLEKLLEERMRLQSEHPDSNFEDDEDDFGPVTIPSESLPRTLPSDPGTSTNARPLQKQPESESPDTSQTTNHHKQRQNASSHAARAKRRANPEFGSTKPRKSVCECYQDGASTIQCQTDLENARVTSTGYVAKRETNCDPKVHNLDYFVGEHSKHNFTLQRWNGKTPTALVDQKNRLVRILAGYPETAKWPDLMEEATQVLEQACQRLEGYGSDEGRRGPFSSIRCSVSHGRGQKEPGNLCNDAKTAKVLRELNSMEGFQRISSFATSVMATRAPRLYEYYSDKMGKLYQQKTNLDRPFLRSIQSATTYNLGPQTVCIQHINGGNLAPGMCGITPFGDFDYRAGGHLVLWECRLVIQFPPGSTILIPSAIISHSNTAIRPNEKRYSFVQYTAGALFHWVDNNFQKATLYRQLLSPEEEEKARIADAAQWEKGLSLLPVIDG